MIENRKINLNELFNKANECTTVIEIGCGEAYNLAQIQSPIKIGIEGYRPLMEKYKNEPSYKDIIPICMNVLDIDKYFLDKSIDCIIAIDVIEHFTLEDAINTIKKCETIAKKYCLFFIPVGNHPQLFDDRGFGNELNYHRSTWQPQMMEELGYKVYYDDNYYHESLRSQGKDLGCMYCIKEL